MPLYRLTHWPDDTAYQHRQRAVGLDHLFEHWKLPDDIRTVVEVGCGDGYVASRLAQRFERVVGFDLNPFRIGKPAAPNILLAAGDAEHLPIRPGSADLVFSHSVMEHLRYRTRAAAAMASILRPGGSMVHVVPMAPWKILQWAGFVPDQLRKHTRGLTRALAGQRKPKQPKFHTGMETNNPKKSRKKSLTRHLLPRVHGEYSSNLDEWKQWRPNHWEKTFQDAGLTVQQIIPLESASPYGFGASQYFPQPRHLGVTTIAAFVMTKGAPA